MKTNALIKIVLVLIMFFMPTALCHAGNDITFSCTMPYYLGQPRDAVVTGEIVQTLVSMENTGLEPADIHAVLEIPAGFSVTGHYENWQVNTTGDTTILKTTVYLEEGYDQWFDFLTFMAARDAAPGSYTVKLTVDGKTREFPLKIAAGNRELQPVAFAKIVLPLDKDGKKDNRLHENTLVLRDRQLDYYKNVLIGKGASNQEMEAVHPVTHMGLDFINPGGQQKLITITSRLLDMNTHQSVNGLYTPGTTGEDKGAGSMAGHNDCLVAFSALTGEKEQRIQIPVYADERFLSAGQYILQVTVDDGLHQMVLEEPVKVVKKNIYALAIVSIAVLVLLIASALGLRKIKNVLLTLKTRWLVTIALFGTAAFAVVNIPATLLNDFFHIILGPFAFLVTGMFNGIFLYMLTAALVILIPHPGVVALMTAVRMLLGMLAFGRISPVSLLSYGLHALLLETLFWLSGFYANHALQLVKKVSLKHILLMVIICGTADSIATYVSMQAMAILYRLYYADWYIYMIMAVNGFLYTAIGAGCGVFLGCQLSKVGGD